VGEIVMIRDRFTGKDCPTSLGLWRDLPDDTVMAWTVRYSIVRSRLRRVR
jgi:hypothetical protein